MANNFGRRVAHDPDDHRYTLGSINAPPMPPPLTTCREHRYYWNPFNWNQTGDTCVANGVTHKLGDGPKTHRIHLLDADYPDYVSAQSGQTGFRGKVYDLAQSLDEWSDTPPEGGTSVRAGFKALQSLGYLTSYWWLTVSSVPESNVELVARYILEVEPVVIGVTWYEGMYTNITPGGWLHATGNSVGGHCVCLDGCSKTDEKVRVQTWGEHYWLSWTDLDKLLADDGEAGTFQEIK